MSEESPLGTPGGHQFPGSLVKAALLSRLNSDVAVSLVPGESTMSAVLAVVRTPAADAVVAKVSKENEISMITSNDEEESVSSTLPHGQIVHSSPEIMDSQEDIFTSMSPVGGEDGAVLNSQGDGAGQQARTRAQPSGTGHQGQSLRATQPTGQQAAHALPARQPVNPNPLLNKGWEDVAMRMATISLQAAGRPYKRTHIEHALVNTGMNCSTIVTLGEFDNNFKYQVTFIRKEIADYFVREFPVLSISTGKGTYNCPVSSFLRREYRVKVAWFPDAGTDQEMAATMRQWGEVVAVHREKVRVFFGSYFSGNRLVTLIPFHDIDAVPDFTDMRANGKLFTVRMSVLGLKARCHNCQQRGHLARECQACSYCGSAAHATADHPPQVPFSTFAERVGRRRRPASPVYAPGEMDDDVTMERSDGVQRQKVQASGVSHTLNAHIQHQLANHPHPGTSGIVQNQSDLSSTDKDGFKLPKAQRDRLRRHKKHSDVTIATKWSEDRSEGDGVESDIDEIRQHSKQRCHGTMSEASDNEMSEVTDKEETVPVTASPKLGEGQARGLTETPGPPPAPPEREQPPPVAQSDSGETQGGWDGFLDVPSLWFSPRVFDIYFHSLWTSRKPF